MSLPNTRVYRSHGITKFRWIEYVGCGAYFKVLGISLSWDLIALFNRPGRMGLESTDLTLPRNPSVKRQRHVVSDIG